ncbi:unnamed protein product [Arctia plantaginis]|uniref:unspecific monooxygenase n=1 Tax=Arctia plantaginis TaxID=874455 RepID=A0A8S1B558_ARCPL|nr:unnamed protein product [Arctia plantaginis]
MVAGLITILKKYRLELAEGMKSKVVLRITTRVGQPYGGIRLKFIKREGNDFVDLVLKLWQKKEISGDSLENMISEEKKKVTLEINEGILASQCFALFGAAYETSATTLGFTLYELAKNPEAQEKVLQEVDSYLHRHNNVLKYESVAEMPYLEACVDEALRLYPVLSKNLHWNEIRENANGSRSDYNTKEVPSRAGRGHEE